jgi:hypothetical protein
MNGRKDGCADDQQVMIKRITKTGKVCNFSFIQNIDEEQTREFRSDEEEVLLRLTAVSVKENGGNDQNKLVYNPTP